MKRSSIQSLLIVCCTVSALLATLSCASTKKKADPIADLRAGIQKEVTDPARAAKASSAVDEMERLTHELGTLVASNRDAVARLLHDYASTREQIEAKLQELDTQRTALARKMIDAHLAFKAATTPAEWEKLKKQEEVAIAYAAALSLGEQPLLGKED